MAESAEGLQQLWLLVSCSPETVTLGLLVLGRFLLFATACAKLFMQGVQLGVTAAPLLAASVPLAHGCCSFCVQLPAGW